jgi:hypothetical protein
VSVLLSRAAMTDPGERSHHLPGETFKHRYRRLALGRSLFQGDKRTIRLVVQLCPFQEGRAATAGRIAILAILGSRRKHRD